MLASHPAWRLATAASLVVVFGCNDSTDTSGSRVAELRVVWSPTLTGTPGWLVADSIVVKALDDEGNPLAGVRLDWAGGAGSVHPELHRIAI